MQVAHPRHRAGACTLNAVGMVCGDVYLTLPYTGNKMISPKGGAAGARLSQQARAGVAD